MDIVYNGVVGCHELTVWVSPLGTLASADGRLDELFGAGGGRGDEPHPPRLIQK